MQNVIIYIKNDKELELAKVNILSQPAIEYTVSELKKLDFENIYLVGANKLTIDGVISRNNINEIIKDLSRKEGKCLIVSPFYPLVSKKEYIKLLKSDDDIGTVLLDEDGACAVFMLPNRRLKMFDNLNLKEFSIIKSDAKRLKTYEDVPEFLDDIKLAINTRFIKKGVHVMDPFSTYISPLVTIDKNTVIYPNTYIEGKCLIGKDNTITSGSRLTNVVIGNNNKIDNSTISNTKILNRTVIGPYVNIKDNSEISNEVEINSNVEVKNSKIGEASIVGHGAYISDATIGNHVNFGPGAVTINFDGTRKQPTTIKDHAFIGANANLIAPIKIGEYSMVAASSTVNEDVADGDLAISRLYQTNKKGYGYRYINKEN